MLTLPVCLAIWTWVPAVLNVVLLLVSIFLVGLVLIQKGKGGGLAGVFGGAGGSSAFGSAAGDSIMRFTILMAAIWILLIMILVKMVQPPTITVPETQNVTPTEVPTEAP